MDRVVNALAKEAVMRKEEAREPISTVYFGGGTPGLLSIEQLATVVNALRANFDLTQVEEFTLETNPDDVSSGKVQGWKSLGVDRLSMGIQSFNDADLNWMNRAHDAKQATESVSIAKKEGIRRLTIDLIYGLPEMKLSDWEKNLRKTIDLEIDHISAYCLTVEPQTALGNWVAKGKENPVDDDAAASQYEFMVGLLAENGFQHYEVSNFALPGCESRHNSAYWEGIPFVALGPSAHGYNGNSRYFNVANNPRYCTAIERSTLPETREKLSLTDRFNEWIMTGLRTAKGIRLERAEREFNMDLRSTCGKKIDDLIQSDLAQLNGDRLSLTEKGLFQADGIASDFFILEHEDQD